MLSSRIAAQDVDRIEAVAFAALTTEQRSRLSEWLSESRRALAAEVRDASSQ